MTNITRTYKHKSPPFFSGYGGLFFKPPVHIRGIVGAKIKGRGQITSRQRDKLIKEAEKEIGLTRKQYGLTLSQPGLIQQPSLAPEVELGGIDLYNEDLPIVRTKKKNNINIVDNVTIGTTKKKNNINIVDNTPIVTTKKKNNINIVDDVPKQIQLTINQQITLADKDIMRYNVGSGDRFETWFEKIYNDNKIIDLPVNGGKIINTKTLKDKFYRPEFCQHDSFTIGSKPCESIFENKCYNRVKSENFKLTLTKFEGVNFNYIPLYYKNKAGTVRFWNAITYHDSKVKLVYPETKQGYEMIGIFFLDDGFFYYDITQDETIIWTKAAPEDIFTINNFFNFYNLGYGNPDIKRKIFTLIKNSGKNLLWFDKQINFRSNGGKFDLVNMTMFNKPTPCLTVDKSKLERWSFKK